MAWAVDQKLPVQQKMVLLMLADRTNKDTGLCIPSMDTLAKNCGMSKASVKRAIKALSELGFIAIHERFSDNVQLSHQYELLAEQTERESNVMGVGSHSTRGVGADSTVGGSDSTRGVGSHSTPNLYKSFNQEFNQERDTPPATRSALPAVKPSRLPDWIDPAAWEGFVAMRKKIRAPLTERAITVTINELERLRSAGQNPNHCLDQSTQHAWRGVFAVKTGDNHAGQRQHRETPLQASLREAEEILQRARDGTLGPEWDFSGDGDDMFGVVRPAQRALPAQGDGVPGEAARRITNT